MWAPRRLAPDGAAFNVPDGHNAVIHPRHEKCIAARREHCTVMYFDPDTIALLRTTLDRAWASLPPGQQAATKRSIWRNKGERDPDRLVARAVTKHRGGLRLAS
jgi:hypothetical protein